ncbi:hypothetical protein MAR_023484 [Mya arenaria]|uniref:C1q domain-containing protein n=1 Tax=Mya arenaria TaxID=6604 RepID=A0ABY7DR88_MYAAR|nr:hypothetical protein MAR_023484 [Mya arenaria]
MDLVKRCFALVVEVILCAPNFCLASKTCSANDVRTAVLLIRETQTVIREQKMDMKQQLNTLQEEIRKKGKEIDNVTLSDNEIIKFDIEETDTVNSYDTTNGMFTAHVDGFYFLAITIHSPGNIYVGAEIVVNGVVKGEAFADSEEIADTHSSSAMTIVQMSAGEKAYVRRGSDSQSGLWSHASRGLSTFSGWLLNKGVCLGGCNEVNSKCNSLCFT